MIYLASSLDKNAAIGAISSGSPNLCMGIHDITSFFTFSERTFVVAVDTYPGAITFTVIFLVATSFATDLVNEWIPAFDAE